MKIIYLVLYVDIQHTSAITRSLEVTASMRGVIPHELKMLTSTCWMYTKHKTCAN